MFLKIQNNFKRINHFWKNNYSFKFDKNENKDFKDNKEDNVIQLNNNEKHLGIKEIFSQSTHPNSQGSIILIEKSKKMKKRKFIDINQPVNRRFNSTLLPLTYNSRRRKKSKNHI